MYIHCVYSHESYYCDYGQNFVEYTKNITYIYNNIFEFILNVQRPHYCTPNFCKFVSNRWMKNTYQSQCFRNHFDTNYKCNTIINILSLPTYSRICFFFFFFQHSIQSFISFHLLLLFCTIRIYLYLCISFKHIILWFTKDQSGVVFAIYDLSCMSR